MNQTKPKTLKEIEQEFDEFYTLPQGMKAGPQREKAIKDLLRTSITTLLESLKREDKELPERVKTNAPDLATVSYDRGYNKRNQELEEDINKILGK